MKQKPKRKKSVIVRLIVLGVSVYMIVNFVGLGFWYGKIGGLVGEYREGLKILEQLENERDTLKLTIDEYKELLDSDSHADIIEKAARERLGFVYSDEEIYIDISGN